MTVATPPATPSGAPPMRLLALSHTGLFSGAERVLVDVLAAAVTDGWHVQALCPPGRLGLDLTDAGVALVPSADLKLPAGRRALAAGRLTGRWLRASTVVRRAARDADVLLVNGLLALPAVRLARLAVPVAWVVHDVAVRSDLRAAARIGAPAVTRGVAVSHAAASFPRSLGVPTDVVWNGTRWPVPARRDVAGPPVVGISAMVTPWKGHLVFLEAAARLPGDVQIEIMGGHFPKDAAHVAAVRARAARPDLAGRVRFLGHVENPVERMRDWTVAVNASTDPEAGPLTVLEALSVGVPVVATDHGGSPEVVHGAGLLVPPDDSHAMADAIAALLADADLRRRLGDAGRARVAADHDLTVTTRRVLAVLAGLAGGRRSRTEAAA